MRRLVAGAALVALLAPVAPAQATEYRYWTYWNGTGGAWTFSSVGPGSAIPADGSAQGWRFAQSTVRGQGSQPRISATEAYARFCGPGSAPGGMKRVAIVFDFGEVGEAPPGQTPPQPRGTCVVIDQRATGSQVLNQAADVRTDRGLVCAIGGYPTGECAPAVPDDPPTTSTPRPQPRPQSAGPRTANRDRPAPAAPAESSASGDSGGGTTATDGDRTESATGHRGNEQATADTTDRTTGGAAAPEPAAPTTPDSATPGPTTTGAVAAAPTQAETPVFVAGTAHSQEPGQPWWPAALTLAVVAAIAGGIWWRRRT